MYNVSITSIIEKTQQDSEFCNTLITCESKEQFLDVLNQAGIYPSTDETDLIMKGILMAYKEDTASASDELNEDDLDSVRGGMDPQTVCLAIACGYTIYSIFKAAGKWAMKKGLEFFYG